MLGENFSVTYIHTYTPSLTHTHTHTHQHTHTDLAILVAIRIHVWVYGHKSLLVTICVNHFGDLCENCGIMLWHLFRIISASNPAGRCIGQAVRGRNWPRALRRTDIVASQFPSLHSEWIAGGPLYWLPLFRANSNDRSFFLTPAFLTDFLTGPRKDRRRNLLVVYFVLYVQRGFAQWMVPIDSPPYWSKIITDSCLSVDTSKVCIAHDFYALNPNMNAEFFLGSHLWSYFFFRKHV